MRRKMHADRDGQRPKLGHDAAATAMRALLGKPFSDTHGKPVASHASGAPRQRHTQGTPALPGEAQDAVYRARGPPSSSPIGQVSPCPPQGDAEPNGSASQPGRGLFLGLHSHSQLLRSFSKKVSKCSYHKTRSMNSLKKSLLELLPIRPCPPASLIARSWQRS